MHRFLRLKNIEKTIWDEINLEGIYTRNREKTCLRFMIDYDNDDDDYYYVSMYTDRR